MIPTLKLFLTSLALLAASGAGAQSPVGSKAAQQGMTSPLSPAQLNAVRTVGRNVLTAKVGKADAASDAADLDQLASLRAVVDRLVAAEFALRHPPVLALQGVTAAQAAGAADASLSTARASASRLAADLRNRVDALTAAVAQSDTGADPAAAAMRVQRARLFERWAGRLEAVLEDRTPDRLARLRELQAYLAGTRSGLRSASPRATPTLQAMPAAPPNTALSQ